VCRIVACRALTVIIVLGFSFSLKAQPTSTDQNSITQSKEKRSKRELIESKVIELKLALEKSPTQQSLLIKLSQSLLKLGRYPEALTHLRTVIERAPNYSDGRYLLAFTLRKLKRYREAITEYETFLGQVEGEKRLSGVFGLAKTLDLIGDPRGAFEQYQEFIDLEKRPSQKRWVDEAKASLRRIQASDVVLIDTDTENDAPKVTEYKQIKQAKSKKSLSAVLQEADHFFADRDYKKASELYEELSLRELPVSITLQTTYASAVSAYLLGQFHRAQLLAERGLLLDDSSEMLKGLAVLSHIQHKVTSNQSTQSTQAILSEVRIALKEGRLRDCLQMIESHLQNQKKSESINPLLLHAKGRALLGLDRNTEAYQVLKLASQGLKYPYLSLDLALAAHRLNKPKIANKHYADLKSQTAPQTGMKAPSLYHLANEALKR
jgi:tetratricopeptide (TPR) repeat protein